jgi:hypothetical protein
VASNNEYKRYFIILQEDDKGYELSPGKIPTGYVKIEVKNNKVRLNAFIQNIKHEDRVEYRLILVSSVKKLAVDAGKIIIDGSGRGELSCELEPDNVLKSGLNIRDFNIAAVTCGTSVPLSGYTGRDKLEWKNKYDIINKHKVKEVPRIDKKIEIEEIIPEVPQPPIHVPQIVQPEPTIVEPPAPAPMPEPEPVMEIKPEPEPAPEPVIEPKPEPAPEPVIEPEPEPVIVPESTVEVKIVVPECPPIAPMEEPCEIECEDIKEYYCYDDEEPCKHTAPPYYSGGMYGKLRRVLRKLRRYEPFEKERGCSWFKVGDNMYEINRVSVPYMGYMMPLGYPFLSEGCGMMMDRKDYILGVKYDDKDDDDDDDRRQIRHLLFGVPAIYSKRNELYYKSRGFMKFRPHKSKNYGYFIMCLDIRRGILCRMH